MTYREKCAWIALLTTLVAWSAFFVMLLRELLSGDPNVALLTAAFAGCSIVMIAVNVAIHIVLTTILPKEAQAAADERERLIALRASWISHVVLSISVLVAVLAVPLIGVNAPHLFPRDPLAGALTLLGGSIFLALMVSELTNWAGQIILFRRSA